MYWGIKIELFHFRIYQALERLQPLLISLRSAEYCAAVREAFIDTLKDLDEDMEKFKEMIATTIDMDQIARGEYLVKADFSEDLAEFRSRLNELERQMETELNKSARELNLEPGKSIKLETNSQIGYHFRTSNKKVTPVELILFYISTMNVHQNIKDTNLVNKR